VIPPLVLQLTKLPHFLLVSWTSKNIDVVVGIALLICIEAKITLVLYSLPVYDRHLKFPSDIGVISGCVTKTLSSLN